MEYWNSLLLVLRPLPRLHQLRLDSILSPVDMETSFIDPENTAKSILLLYLETLTLTVPISWVMALLAQLKFPESTIIRLKCNCDDPHAISRLLSFSLGRFGSHSPNSRTQCSWIRSCLLLRTSLGGFVYVSLYLYREHSPSSTWSNAVLAGKFLAL